MSKEAREEFYKSEYLPLLLRNPLTEGQKVAMANDFNLGEFAQTCHAAISPLIPLKEREIRVRMHGEQPSPRLVATEVTWDVYLNELVRRAKMTRKFGRRALMYAAIGQGLMLTLTPFHELTVQDQQGGDIDQLEMIRTDRQQREWLRERGYSTDDPTEDVARLYRDAEVSIPLLRRSSSGIDALLEYANRVKGLPTPLPPDPELEDSLNKVFIDKGADLAVFAYGKVFKQGELRR